MKERTLQPGDIVQIKPESESAFAGCLMIVSEPKNFGAQGYIFMPTERGKPPGRAYYRAKWSEIEWVGFAHWTLED